MFKKLAIYVTGIMLGISVLTACEGQSASTFQTKSEILENSEIADVSENLDDWENLNIWNGIYQNGNISLTLYRLSLDKITLSISRYNSGDGYMRMSFPITLDSTKRLSYEGIYFENEISIIIDKTNEGITLQASSSDDENLLNIAGGSYVKSEFSNSGWDGVYKNGNTSIILAETQSGVLHIEINRGISNYSSYFGDYSDREISYENESFEHTDNVSIIKTDYGIELLSYSTRDSSLLNKVSGSYTKTD